MLHSSLLAGGTQWALLRRAAACAFAAVPHKEPPWLGGGTQWALVRRGPDLAWLAVPLEEPCEEPRALWHSWLGFWEGGEVE